MIGQVFKNVSNSAEEGSVDCGPCSGDNRLKGGRVGVPSPDTAPVNN